jgi:hypothetical protein
MHISGEDQSLSHCSSVIHNKANVHSASWKSVIMTNKAQLYARRREMYRLYAQKSNMTEILDKLSAKYCISKQALWQDWQKRTQWVYDVLDLEPARVLLPV